MQILIQYAPRVLGALAIVLVGLALAFVARRSLTFLLRRMRFDEFCAGIGVYRVGGADEEGDGPGRGPTDFAGSVVFYGVLLFSALVALGPLGLDFLSIALNQIVLYAPKVFAAILIVVLGTSLAGVVSEIAGRSLGGVGVRRTTTIKTSVRFAVIFVAAILAAAVLEIDVTILIVITIIALGAVALTASLALGLGLRGLSKNVAAGRYVSEGVEEGDEISLGSVFGTVEEIGHAMTKVRSPNGKLYLVPNSHFLENVVEKRERAREDTPPD